MRHRTLAPLWFVCALGAIAALSGCSGGEGAGVEEAASSGQELAMPPPALCRIYRRQPFTLVDGSDRTLLPTYSVHYLPETPVRRNETVHIRVEQIDGDDSKEFMLGLRPADARVTPDTVFRGWIDGAWKHVFFPFKEFTTVDYHHRVQHGGRYRGVFIGSNPSKFRYTLCVQAPRPSDDRP